MKRTVMVTLALALLVSGFAVVSAATGCKGGGSGGTGTWHSCGSNHKNSMVIVGDSRMHMTYQQYHSDASYITVVGGHYLNAYHNNKYAYVDIRKASRIHQMKENIRDSLKKRGYCKVIVAATINDGGSLESKNNQIALCKDLYGITEKHKRKTVRAKVYAAELIYGGGVSKNTAAKYNRALKSACDSKKVTYLNLPVPTGSDFCDNYGHFKSSFTKKMMQKFKSIRSE